MEQCAFNTKPQISNPLNATFDITVFKDELPKGENQSQRLI